MKEQNKYVKNLSEAKNVLTERFHKLNKRLMSVVKHDVCIKVQTTF